MLLFSKRSIFTVSFYAWEHHTEKLFYRRLICSVSFVLKTIDRQNISYIDNSFYYIHFTKNYF